ncbi:MAG: hypothetical protein HFI88_15035 [Lachnospiraceae bacterium]|nr:hypothetical protein [Lachnospiraceae bacterium]
MLKVRVQGTRKDIHWFLQLLERNKDIRMLQASDIYGNKGTNKYFRAYADVERTKK